MFSARGNVHYTTAYIEAASDFFKMTKVFPTSTLNSEPDRDDEVAKRFRRVRCCPDQVWKRLVLGVDGTYAGFTKSTRLDPKPISAHFAVTPNFTLTKGHPLSS